MQLNKNQITMAAIGGVALAGALILAVVCLFFNDSSKAQQTLQAKTSSYNQNKGATQEQVDALKAMEQKANAWSDKAYEAIEPEAKDDSTEGAFQKQIQSQYNDFARPVVANGATNAFLASEFKCEYFREYFTGKNIAKADLPLVKRRWIDISGVVKILQAGGATQLSSVDVLTPEPKKKEDSASTEGQSAEAAKPAHPIHEENYRFAFSASPAALTAVLNKLSETGSFISVDSMKFESTEPLVTNLGGAVSKDASSGRGGRRGRRAEAQAEETEATKEKKGYITDSSKLLTVTLTVSTLTADKEVK